MTKSEMAGRVEEGAQVGRDENVIPALDVRALAPRELFGPGKPASPGAADDRSIGVILVDAGRLTLEKVERILRVQREKGMRFGDAGKALRLLTQADIEFALSRQFDCPYLQPGSSSVSRAVVAAYEPFRPEVEALRALRSQLMLRWFDDNPARKALAVISAAPQEGRSFIAANLAVVFSQLGERTLLIDADLRNPVQHRLFGVSNRIGLSTALAARAGPEPLQPIPGLPRLTVLPAGPLPPNPQELLARPGLPDMLQAVADRFDVILLDTPPASATVDAQTVVLRAGAALIVARKNATRAWRVQGISDSLAQGNVKATIVGTILNDF